MKISGRGKRRKNKLPYVALLVSPPTAPAFVGPIREKEIEKTVFSFYLINPDILANQYH